MRLWKRPSSK